MGPDRRGLMAATVWVAFAGCPSGASLPLTRALLGEHDTAVARAALDDVVARVGRRIAAGEGAADALARTVFDDLGFVREVDLRELRFMRLGPVLASRRGSCLGLGSLYLAVGEVLGPKLGFRVTAVLVPGHLFVRVQDRGTTRPAELLRRGEAMPEAWYREKYAVPAAGAPAYLRPLAHDEVLGVLDFNIGNDLLDRGQLAAARAAYARAAGRFPQLAEAHASLGLVLHLQGAYGQADSAYRAAAAHNPYLPGLAGNRARLEAQRGGAE